MAAQRQSVHAHQPRRAKFGHAGLDALQHVAQPLRGKGGGEFEGGKLVGVVDRPHAVGRVHQQIGGVDDGARRSGETAQRVGDEGGQVERRLAKAMVEPRERLPADRADALAGLQAGVGQDVGQRFGPVAGLGWQAEGLAEHALVGSVAEFGIAPALVADEEFWRAAGHDDEKRLLEAGIVAGEEGDVGAMLAVAIDDERIEVVCLCAGEGGVHPCLERGAGYDGHDRGLAELGQRDLLQGDGGDGHGILAWRGRVGHSVASSLRICNSAHSFRHLDRVAEGRQ